jgi:hypothetical protein
VIWELNFLFRFFPFPSSLVLGIQV